MKKPKHKRMLKFFIALIFSIVLIFSLIYLIDIPLTRQIRYFISSLTNYEFSLKSVKVPNEYSKTDSNNNGIADPLDMVSSAREEAKRKTNYKSVYYSGGYPPENEGVCTDVIWRAFKGINVSLKDLVDKDIKENTKLYYRVQSKPDPNIDFRRVPNLDVFFSRYAESLTTEIIPGDINNLNQWQPGDIIVIMEPYEHIAIISDKRSKDGVPYVIHNSTPHAAEVAHFNLWGCKIKAHYRWKY